MFYLHLRKRIYCLFRVRENAQLAYCTVTPRLLEINLLSNCPAFGFVQICKSALPRVSSSSMRICQSAGFNEVTFARHPDPGQSHYLQELFTISQIIQHFSLLRPLHPLPSVIPSSVIFFCRQPCLEIFSMHVAFL